CTFTNTRKTLTLNVAKHLIGDSVGKFNLKIGNTIVKPNAGDGESGGTTVNAGDTVSVSETEGTGTSLANYNSSLACDNGVIPTPNTNTAGSIPVLRVARPISCTFTNTRKTLTLNVAKHVIGDTTGRFNLKIGNTIVRADAADGHFGGTTVNVGDILSVSET